MANRDMKVSVLVQLVDRLTAPLRAMTNGIAGVANRVADLGRRIGVVGAALAALSFTAPLQQAAAWDAQLRDIAITAGKTGGAVESMIGEIGKRYETLSLQTGQRSMDLAKGAQTLVASGLDAGLIDRLMPTIARVATAANATIEDTAKTAFALSDTLKVAPDQMEAALAKLVTAGKLGRFEFKNMASEFPGLTAQMAKFGITGMEAVETLGASLQIAMLGTANPSEAATNLTNFLTKINAPEAVKKFEKELKVDITGVMTDAAAKGINPIEAVLEKMTSKLAPQQAEIDKIMKKAGISDKQREEQIKTLLAGTKVGKLYADMQVLGFVLPFLQNREKYLAFRKEIAASGVDVIAADFESRMRGLSQSLAMFGELGTQAMRRIGLAFASNLPVANRAIAGLLRWVSETDKAFPGLIDKTLSWTGALLMLGAALAVLTPVLSALAGLVSVLVSPFVLAAAAIAGAAAVIYRNWETIGPFFSTLLDHLTQIARGFVTAWEGLFSSDFGRALEGVLTIWNGLKDAVGTVWQIIISTTRLAFVEIDKLLGTDLVAVFQKVRTAVSEFGDSIRAKIEEVAAAFRQFPEYLATTFSGLTAVWDTIKLKGDELVAWAQALPGRITGAIADLAGQLREAGANAIQGLWDGMTAKFEALLGWFREKMNQLKSLIPSFSLGGGSSGAPGGPAVDPMGNPTGAPAGAPGKAANANLPTMPVIVLPKVETMTPGADFGSKVLRDLRAQSAGGGDAAPGAGTGLGGQSGFTRTAGGPAANSNVQVGGRILVQAAEGTRIVNVQSENPAVPVTPDRGTMVGRP